VTAMIGNLVTGADRDSLTELSRMLDTIGVVEVSDCAISFGRDGIRIRGRSADGTVSRNVHLARGVNAIAGRPADRGIR
jgi:hypothetical protein